MIDFPHMWLGGGKITFEESERQKQIDIEADAKKHEDQENAWKLFKSSCRKEGLINPKQEDRLSFLKNLLESQDSDPNKPVREIVSDLVGIWREGQGYARPSEDNVARFGDRVGDGHVNEQLWIANKVLDYVKGLRGEIWGHARPPFYDTDNAGYYLYHLLNKEQKAHGLMPYTLELTLKIRQAEKTTSEEYIRSSSLFSFRKGIVEAPINNGKVSGLIDTLNTVSTWEVNQSNFKEASPMLKLTFERSPSYSWRVPAAGIGRKLHEGVEEVSKHTDWSDSAALRYILTAGIPYLAYSANANPGKAMQHIGSTPPKIEMTFRALLSLREVEKIYRRIRAWPPINKLTAKENYNHAVFRNLLKQMPDASTRDRAKAWLEWC